MMYRGQIGDKTFYGALSFDVNGTAYICFNKDGVHHREQVAYVAEYAGFADKNGKDVFIGDLVNMHYKREYADMDVLVRGIIARDMLGTYVETDNYRYYLLNNYEVVVRYNGNSPAIECIEVVN